MTPTIEWFMGRVGRFGGCWLWTAAVTPSGYGTVSWRDGECTVGRPAHRLSYELHVGEIPSGFEIHHLCAYRRCVKPDHLIALPAESHREIHSSWRNDLEFRREVDNRVRTGWLKLEPVA